MKKFTAYFLVFYLVWIIRATVFYSAVDLSISSETERLIFSNLVKFVLWVLPAAVYLVWIDRQDPLRIMRVRTPVDKQGLLIGSLGTCAYFILIFGLERFVSGRTLAPLVRANVLLWAVTLAKVFFSPITEELLFRGFMLPKLGTKTPFWAANAIQAALFTAMHWPNWIWVNGLASWLPQTSLATFALGLLFGWLCKRTNSIWPPVIAHIVNNFLTAFLA